MIPSDHEILERVQKIVAQVLRIPIEQVTPNSLLGEDLGAESLDFVDIQFQLETDYGVQFYQGSAVEKLSELLAPQKLEQNGLLTAFGAAVLCHRMPEVNSAGLREGFPAAGVEAMFTPQTWARTIKELLSARPQSCPKCQSDELKVVQPLVLLCEDCRSEIRCPSGEECLEAWARSVAGSLQEVHKPSSG